jgi:hypothetical protein
MGQRRKCVSRELHFFSTEKGMKIINWGQGFSYIREQYQQLRK